MPISIIDTTLTGLAAGGLPAGVINSSNYASSGRLAITTAIRNSAQSLSGDSGWQDHVSLAFTTGVASRAMFFFMPGVTWESGAVQGFYRFVLDGSKIGYNWCGGRQSAGNNGHSGSGLWFADVSAAAHTIKIQARNVPGSTWQTPYWSADGEGVNMLTALYYA